MLVPDPEWHVRIEMVEQVACRRLDEGPSSSDANVEARRVHNLLRWMLSVLREDGTSHYLKGLVLCLAYVVIAACFFVQKLPSSSFKLGSEKHTTEVVLTKVGALRVTSGIEDLSLLKTAQSGFEGFVRDKNTILPETSERMLATEVSASWRYPFESPTSIPVKPLYFTKMYLDVKKVLAETFFGPPNEGIYSPSVQATLYQMGKVVLDPSPVGRASRSLFLGEDASILSYKATTSLVTASNCCFSKRDMDPHLLVLLKQQAQRDAACLEQSRIVLALRLGNINARTMKSLTKLELLWELYLMLPTLLGECGFSELDSFQILLKQDKSVLTGSQDSRISVLILSGDNHQKMDIRT
ncbi:hypothetical protein AgCh_033111 [Apium graveolens]